MQIRPETGLLMKCASVLWEVPERTEPSSAMALDYAVQFAEANLGPGTWNSIAR
jgi:hypothetical protein